ncbi:unnamed protein product [Ceratitis capitata]|uniref:(Mediterranean fruit fly) hypothetical protein n=1 Tax=Ceratitis capitata TaxID=7213 RepID=A0A811UP71_CERCA|nr:unnamed protein product [Ceratitis capitata]
MEHVVNKMLPRHSTQYRQMSQKDGVPGAVVRSRKLSCKKQQRLSGNRMQRDQLFDRSKRYCFELLSVEFTGWLKAARGWWSATSERTLLGTLGTQGIK